MQFLFSFSQLLVKSNPTVVDSGEFSRAFGGLYLLPDVVTSFVINLHLVFRNKKYIEFSFKTLQTSFTVFTIATRLSYFSFLSIFSQNSADANDLEQCCYCLRTFPLNDLINHAQNCDQKTVSSSQVCSGVLSLC